MSIDDEFEIEIKQDFLTEAIEMLNAAEQAFLVLETNGSDQGAMDEIFRLAHSLKGTSSAVGLSEIADFTHELENLILEIKNGKVQVTERVVTILLESNDFLKAMVEGLAKDLNKKFNYKELKEQITSLISGDSSPKEVIEESDMYESEELQGLQKVEKNKKVLEVKPEESIRVNMGKLQKLNDYVGELVILQSVLNEHRHLFGSEMLVKSLSQLGKLSKEIHGISMSLRMVPIKSTVQKLHRIVRDTNKALGKESNLVIFGEETEVDKTVVEYLGDPLVHIIRNAVDHGIESPEERKEAGKDVIGEVKVRCFHEGNNLVIEIKDDGKGICPEVLHKKAIEKGVIQADAKISEEEIYQLIFHPGFSTKSEVSQVSGRGVGMDVVKTNIESLSGSINLQSKKGEGSTFKISLPLTMAVIEGMITRVENQKFVIPLTQVYETLRYDKKM